MSQSMFWLGLIVQVVLTVILLFMVFTYKGQRKVKWFDFENWIHPWTLRYGIIMFSMILNAILIFLYWLNVSGTNTLVFNS
ncbi:hypothetical protein [Paucilactobacillus nenjiangensis]|uniref:hypothetical protein n=1 Tax=Paucilactobacillus nenjiangensis TaxID=1296540 RepID=UPI0010F4EEFB|nr:hypothetical protein [Paucilactobacillus nenjiangensis]